MNQAAYPVAPGWEIRQGDALTLLRAMPEASVQCVVTSPPYWALRAYGTAPQAWGGEASCAHEWGADAGAFCARCGAWCGEFGLEPTPELYVEHAVTIFREVRRVLRPDGTLWLNLGDCYATGAGKVGAAPGGGEQGAQTARTAERSGHEGKHGYRVGPLTQPNRMPLPGLRPKDLVGIPWLVAKALQAPRYTGRMQREADRAWLAAMIDGEGCIFIHKRKIGQDNGKGYERKSDSYGSGLEVANTSTAIVERVLSITGRGSICSQTPEQSPGRKQTILRWNLRSNECRDVLREVYPYLVAKQQQARLAIGCPSSGPKAEAAHAALIGLHRGHATAVDFPEPPSCYEPGWYLRCDVIWSKLNPMPESVTDRPTKAHEYLFLMAKSERYYYDAEAIAEPTVWEGQNRYADPATHRYNAEGLGPTLPRHKGLHRAGPNGGPKGNSRTFRGGGAYTKGQSFDNGASVERESHGNVPNESGYRNRRSVWSIATEPFPEAHFATFPQELVEPCILAGSRPGDLVLDPFAGSGTVGVVALRHGRRFLGLELNGAYVEMARRRIAGPLFAGQAEPNDSRPFHPAPSESREEGSKVTVSVGVTTGRGAKAE